MTLSAAYDLPVTVTSATADSTATAGSDYGRERTLTFAPGETSKTITILVNGDRLAEPNETFVVNLSSPTNATIAAGQGVGTIIDDEPRISIGDVSKKEGNSGLTAFAFTVSLSAAYDVPVTVAYATANGTATAGSDYRAATGTLTIPAGQTSGTITVQVIGDRLAEPNETFVVNLEQPELRRRHPRSGRGHHPRRRAAHQHRRREQIRGQEGPNDPVHLHRDALGRL